MAIYGRFHSEDFPNILIVERMAVLDDIRRLDKRKPDKIDRKAIELGSYVIVREQDGHNAGGERLYHIGYLKADGGWGEISDAIEASKARAAPVVTESTPQQPRQIVCSYCQRTIAVNRDGTVRKHGRGNKACQGSGRPEAGFALGPVTR